jgi:hypothetical protein
MLRKDSCAWGAFGGFQGLRGGYAWHAMLQAIIFINDFPELGRRPKKTACHRAWQSGIVILLF